MVRGILYATFACFFWGFIFVIPNMLPSFTSVEVVLGRYTAYGIFSLIMLLRRGWRIPLQFPPRAWLAALIFALASNIFYYFGVVWGLRFASPPVTVLVVGLAPILIALYGNWHVREISYRHMILPCIWIAAGVVLVNVSEFSEISDGRGFSQYVAGMGGVIVALFGWSLYVVHNARFLKKNVHLPVEEWASVIGTVTFALSALIALFFIFLVPSQVDLEHFNDWSLNLFGFIMGVVTLGVASSWGGCYLWNRASSYLPVSILGPLMILETLFGLIFVYLVALRLPTWTEAAGILILISGLLFALRVFNKRKFTHT